MKHLTRQFFEQLLAEDRPQESQVQDLMDHLLELCPSCRERHDAALERSEALAPKAFDELLQRIVPRLVAEQPLIDRLRYEAKRDLRGLLQLAGSERRLRIHRARKRFRNPFLTDLLIEASRASAATDPFEAYELAECARDVALRIPEHLCSEQQSLTCLARADAWRGNALRAMGEFKAADPILTTAHQLYGDHGTSDPLIAAELAALLGTLRRQQRRYGEAGALFDEAVDLYGQCRDEPGLAYTWIKKSNLAWDRGDLAEAIQATRAALQYIDRQADRALYLSAQHNLALYLQDAGHSAEARDLVAANSGLYREFPDGSTQLRLNWLLGRIARSLGQLSDAETTFQRVREGFLAEGKGLDAALAGLDLALVYVESGKKMELRRLAQDLVPVFRAQDVHREAAAALALFQEAAWQEVVTAQMVTELIGFMQRIQRSATRRLSR